MAVAIIQRFPEGIGAAEYDAASEKLDPESNPPEGLIFHYAGELEGRFQVFDVWQSRENFDRFVEERLLPVQKELWAKRLSLSSRASTSWRRPSTITSLRRA